jgi:hypothetical protein
MTSTPRIEFAWNDRQLVMARRPQPDEEPGVACCGVAPR